MGIKAVLKSLLFAYGLTGLFMFLLAFLLFQFDLGEAPVMAGILAVYVLSCLAGGFMAGKMVKKEKFLWGMLVGIGYFLLLVIVSFIVQGKWDMTLKHAVTTFLMCVGGGTLGGMIS